MGEVKERGVIFNDEMVRAILSGRKDQFRKIINPQPNDDIKPYEFPNKNVQGWISSRKHKFGTSTAHIPQMGHVGDRIWVRESWARYNVDQDSHDMAYRATTPVDWPKDGRWRPSSQMPRWASRITLEITGVRVERLQAISENDAKAEGTYFSDGKPNELGVPTQLVVNVEEEFAHVWTSIYGADSWQANPWVWVIDFKVIEIKGR